MCRNMKNAKTDKKKHGECKDRENVKTKYYSLQTTLHIYFPISRAAPSGVAHHYFPLVFAQLLGLWFSCSSTFTAGDAGIKPIHIMACLPERHTFIGLCSHRNTRMTSKHMFTRDI